MGGRSAKQKGSRVEREIVNTHKAAGIHAERVDARLGQFGAVASYDIDVYWKGKEEAPLCGEIKARKKFPAWMTGYLADNDFLCLREDGRQPIYLVPHHVWIKLLTK